jgi:protein-disulfide isomerase
MHNQAFKAAEASHCAADQGRFWEMHDRMMAKQDGLENLESYAESINLDIPQFRNCMDTDKHAETVRRDMAQAKELGINGTPSFVLAATDPEDPSRVRGIQLLRGAQPFPNFKQVLDRALADTEP